MSRLRYGYEWGRGIATAARFARGGFGVRVCWDLDNTLIDTGSLLRVGVTLEEAVVNASPLPNMLSFHQEVRAAVPAACHIFVTARRRSLRAATLRWLERYAVIADGDGVCFLPSPAAKPQVWRRLSRGGPLVIIDDLSWGHESEVARPYHELVESANAIAAHYVGAPRIAAVVRDASAATALTRDIIRAVGEEGRS